MKILVAIDSSKASDSIIDWIINRNWNSEDEFSILSVVELPQELYASAYSSYSSTLKKLHKDMMKNGKKHLELEVNKLNKHLSAHKIYSELVKGDARDFILKKAKQWSADVIIVGSHGKSGFRKLLIGSVSASIVEHSSCTVFVVK